GVSGGRWRRGAADRAAGPAAGAGGGCGLRPLPAGECLPRGGAAEPDFKGRVREFSAKPRAAPRGRDKGRAAWDPATEGWRPTKSGCAKRQWGRLATCPTAVSHTRI